MILVTGCAGFIGSRITELLLEQGEDVLGIDTINDAYDPRLKEWRLARLQEHPKLIFRPVDITDREPLGALFAEHSIAAVINLAARAGVRYSVEDPYVYFETNVVGTLNLLELCRAHGTEKFVLASTSSVYGPENQIPFNEEDKTDRPRSPYGASKKAAELLCHSYHFLHGLDVSVLRFFTVYGPAARPDMGVFRFIRWINEEEELILYGDGTQTRDFTYIDDIARGAVLSLKKVGFEVINLGSDHPESVATLIAHVEGFLGKRARISRREAHAADPLATWADIAKAERLLGWRPGVSFEEGVRRSAAWYVENRAWAREIDLGPP